jgi:hypothetical protein
MMLILTRLIKTKLNDMLSISLEFSHHNSGKKSSKRDIRPKNPIFYSF